MPRKRGYSQSQPLSMFKDTNNALEKIQEATRRPSKLGKLRTKRLEELLAEADRMGCLTDHLRGHDLFDLGHKWYELHPDAKIHEAWIAQRELYGATLGLIVYGTFYEVGIGEPGEPYELLKKTTSAQDAEDAFTQELEEWGRDEDEY